MKNEKNSGISMITIVITIIVMLILATVAIMSSTRMIDDSSNAKESANADFDNDKIRTILTQAIYDTSAREGIPLVTGSLVIVGPDEKEYGTGWYLLPGGTDDDLDVIAKKTGRPSIEKYKDLTASYVVDYDNGDFARIKEVIFK